MKFALSNVPSHKAAMKRSAISPGTTPLKRTGFSHKPKPKLKPKHQHPPQSLDDVATKPQVTRPCLKSRQRAVSALEKVYWNRLANEVGCIACRLAGRATSNYVSIHHIDGRTKPGCHSLVLPLCAGCHQQGCGNDPSLIAVHPNRKRFEAMYGLQRELKAICDAYLSRTNESCPE